MVLAHICIIVLSNIGARGLLAAISRGDGERRSTLDEQRANPAPKVCGRLKRVEREGMYEGIVF